MKKDIELARKLVITKDNSSGGRIYEGNGLLVGPNSETSLIKLRKEIQFIWDEVDIPFCSNPEVFFEYLLNLLPPTRFNMGSEWRFDQKITNN